MNLSESEKSKWESVCIYIYMHTHIKVKLLRYLNRYYTMTIQKGVKKPIAYI